jgi:ATP-dependent helicase/nuclease subunit A
MSGAHRAAYQAGGAPVDRDVFYALACDPQRSMVVEACAGAGKTWMLVSRMLRALLEGAQPHEILAITFTRKAAGEMRQRLTDWLREFAAPGTPHEVRVRALVERGVPRPRAEELAPSLAGLHERLLAGGRPVEIRTFHAWFSQLLRAAPLELLAELGLQPDVVLIEDIEDHRGEVFRRFHAAILRSAELQRDHLALVARRGRSQTRKWFEAAWAKRVEFELSDVAGVLEGSVAAVGEPGSSHPAQVLLGQPWRESLRELAVALGMGAAKAQDAATGIVMALAEADAADAEAEADADADADAGASVLFDALWAALFAREGTPRKQLGNLAALASVQSALEDIGRQIEQHEAHEEHLRMVRLSRVLLAEYAAYKRARGLADMSDLEACGLALLRDATLAAWVQERLDARIRHVLIDEFQDTSPLQWHALHAWLSAYAGAGGGASGQRAPSVFIVGDPKQSIYRFRRAEPRVFAAASSFVAQALGGALLACDHTRRNAPEVLQVLNAVFDSATLAGEFSGFRAHTTELAAVPGAAVFALPRVLRPPRAAKSAASTEWRDTLTTPRHEPDTVLREQEAALVAKAVHTLVVAQQVRPADIFVLSRKRQSLRLVADALRALHVPYAAAEPFALMAAPEARDLVALLDCLVAPEHRLSLAQALRSPLFGASDDDLVALAQQAAGGDWWRALFELNPVSGALARARTLLQRWSADAQTLPPHDLLDRIVAEGQVRERVVATVPAEQRVAALEAISAVLGQALLLDGGRYATPYNFVRALKRRAIQVAAPTQPDAVQLLTVHGAKGLEARVVFVMDADPEKQKAENATLLVDWPIDAARPHACAFVYSEAACPPSLAALLADERAARQREELNGLYVAMSRAKEQLVFSATEPYAQAPNASWWQRVDPLAIPWSDAPLASVPVLAAPLASVPVLAAVPLALLRAPPVWHGGGAASPAPIATAMPPPSAADSVATRLGQAVHRVLEWASSQPPPEHVDLGALAQGAALEFGSRAGEVERLAGVILHSPACARFFHGPGLRWAGNEVPVSLGGEPLRIDRLVLLEDSNGPVWWVLDYKLQHAPQALADYREQLLRYRAAVLAAQAGAVVRCAFLTGAGALVEVGPADT